MAELPLAPPAIASPFACASDGQAQQAFQRLKSRLAGTRFVGARPSQVCGLVQVEMEGGKKVYTDLMGRFFIVGLVLDTSTGSPADAQAIVDHNISEREKALQSLTDSR